MEVGIFGYDDLFIRGNNFVCLLFFYIVEFEFDIFEYDWGSIDLLVEFGIEGLFGKFYSIEFMVDL